MKAKHPLNYAPPCKPEIRDWRRTFSWPLLFVGAIFGVLALLWPSHRELWAFAGAFALTGVIARYAS
jgi:hypothetical protein